MMDFSLLALKDATLSNEVSDVQDVDLDVVEYEVNTALTEIEAEEVASALQARKEQVRTHLVQVRNDLEKAGEETSLLNHFKEDLSAAGIDTESNQTAIESIDSYIAAYDEANKPAEVTLEADAEPSNEAIGAIVGIIALILGLVVTGTVVAAGVLFLMVGIKIIVAMFKFGGWLLNFTKDNDQLLNSKSFNENKNRYDLVDAKDCIGLAKAYNDIANAYLQNSDKFDVKMIESIGAKLRPFGYGFDGSDFKPKTVLVTKSVTLAEAGWGEDNIRACNQELKALGTTLVKFEQVMKSAERDAKATATKLKEKSDKEDVKPTDEEKAKAKAAVAMAKAIPKLLLKDASRIAKANRYAIKLTMK